MTEQQEKKASFAPIEGKVHTMEVPLDFPVVFDGEVHSSITLRRATIGEWRRYFDLTADGSRAPMPCIDAPIEVYDGLDADDDERLQEAITYFFPKRFQVKQDSESGPATGAHSPPSRADT